MQKKHVIRPRLVLISVIAIVVLGSCNAINGIISVGTTEWSADAATHRTEIGKTFSYTFAPNLTGSQDSVWGTDVYTDDSSIGWAAVHAGKLKASDGGTVKIKMLAGQASYTGSTRNGVTSDSYDSWYGSFSFVD